MLSNSDLWTEIFLAVDVVLFVLEVVPTCPVFVVVFSLFHWVVLLVDNSCDAEQAEGCQMHGPSMIFAVSRMSHWWDLGFSCSGGLPGRGSSTVDSLAFFLPAILAHRYKSNQLDDGSSVEHPSACHMMSLCD